MTPCIPPPSTHSSPTQTPAEAVRSPPNAPQRPTSTLTSGQSSNTTSTFPPTPNRDASPQTAVPSHTSPEQDSSSCFESLFDKYKSQMPEPGPSYFAERRALWLEPPTVPPRAVSPSPSRIKLEALLNQPGAVENEDVWKAGLKNVWKGLVGGNQLRKRLPLSIVLKILQAGWLRDGTWPEGMLAPMSDDHPPAEIIALPPLDVPSSEKDLRRNYLLETETPSTVMDTSPLRSPTSEIIGLRESADEATAMGNNVEQSSQAAARDEDTTRGDGRHEGG